jgi:hypothetical protein
MGERWYVRVLDKEYGPVNAQTLREWKADGRLIAENELRRVGDREWTRAGDHALVFPDTQTDAGPAEEAPTLFSQPHAAADSRRNTPHLRARFRAVLRPRAHRGGPVVRHESELRVREVSAEGDFGGSPLAAIVIGVSMLVLMLLARPLFIGGVQFATAELEAGRRVGVAQVVTRAREIWPRCAKLMVVVWSSYLFWITLPLARDPDHRLAGIGGTVLIQMVAFGFLVFMAGRLFINFMFWQQATALGNLEGVHALKEARSWRAAAPTRPAWSGRSTAA